MFKDICSNVENFLLEEFRNSFQKLEKNLFIIKQGSTIVHIIIKEYEENESLISCRSYVVSGANFSYDLFKKLLLMNSEDLMFGKFGIDKNGYITLDHILLGSTMDKDELIKAVKEISITADDLDDVIVKQYGGQRAIEDYINESQDF